MKSARQAAPFLLLLVLLCGVGVAAPGFLRLQTLGVVAGDASVLFTIAAGLTFVILLGGIDLSIQAVASLASILLAQSLPVLGGLAFPVVIAAGLVVGLVSGFVHVRFRIPSFVATLATGGVVSGLSLLAAHGRTVTILEAGRALCDWITATHAGIPGVVLVGVSGTLVCLVLQHYAPFGRYALAIGAGEPAAWAAGVRVDRIKIWAFGLSGAFAAVAGELLAAQLSSGSPNLADNLLLPAIAAVVVGGTAITGGAGGIGRTLLGALIVAGVRIGMTFLNVDIFAQNIVFGAVLVLAISVTIDRSKMVIVK